MEEQCKINTGEGSRFLSSQKPAKEFICLQCHTSYDDQPKLKMHLRRSHGAKIHKCAECGKSFSLLNKLKIHSLCHAQFSEFLCALCGKRFKRQDKLRSHIQKIHSSQKKEKVFKIKPEPLRSKRYRFPKLNGEDMAKFMYQCTICVIGFHRRGILVNHMIRLHPQIPLNSVPQLCKPVLRPQRTFRCHYCDRVYMSNGKRKNHIVSSHPDANLQATSRLLNTQKTGEVKLAPRFCNLCPRQFLTNAKLIQHHRKCHPLVNPENGSN